MKKRMQQLAIVIVITTSLLLSGCSFSLLPDFDSPPDDDPLPDSGSDLPQSDPEFKVPLTDGFDFPVEPQKGWGVTGYGFLD